MRRFSAKVTRLDVKTAFRHGPLCPIQHELTLIGVKGKPDRVADHSIPSVIRSKRGKHSVKPVAAYIGQLTPVLIDDES